MLTGYLLQNEKNIVVLLILLKYMLRPTLVSNNLGSLLQPVERERGPRRINIALVLVIRIPKRDARENNLRKYFCLISKM